LHTEDLVDNNEQAIRTWFYLGERAETIDKQEDGSFIVTSNKGTRIHAAVVAGGLGSLSLKTTN
jgi:thioredoxin reductase (NADPH)